MLDGDLMASLGGWCAKCMVRLTGRGHRDGCVDPSFPVVDKIRSGRLKWLGHVLRSDQNNLVGKELDIIWFSQVTVKSILVMN